MCSRTVERNHFSRPQAQPGEQQQDGVVTPTNGRPPIATTQYALHRSWWKKLPLMVPHESIHTSGASALPG
jgi:hypothetical protein